MNILDLKTIKAFPYKDRDKNVLFKSGGFKARVIEAGYHAKLIAVPQSSTPQLHRSPALKPRLILRKPFSGPKTSF